MGSWHWVVWPALAIAIVGAVFGLDRLGLWLEDHGWLYYRRKKPTSGLMTALVGMQQGVEPCVKHVVEVKHHQRSEKEMAAGKARLLALLVEVLRSSLVNVEAVRLYLAAAKEMGLDWLELYEEASMAVGGTRLPPLEDVAPDLQDNIGD
jgi:hypothetical protein